MSASDLDKTLNYGPMGHDNIPVRISFGVFKGLLFSPVGKFALAGWSQPFTTQASHGTAYQTYEELFARFGITKGVNDEGFDWSLYPDWYETIIRSIDIQNSSLIISLKEQYEFQGGADQVFRFSGWDTSKLYNRIYQLPIDIEDPPVEGRSTPQEDPITGSSYYELKDASTGKIALISSHRDDLGAKSNAQINDFFINYYGSASRLPKKTPEFNAYSSSLTKFTLESLEGILLLTAGVKQFNAYNFGQPIFRESLEGLPTQDHSDPDILRITSFALKKIDMGNDEYKYWILYSHAKYYAFIVKLWNTTTKEYENTVTDVYTLKEKIYAIECTVEGDKIALVYPRNKKEIAEITYVDRLLKSVGGPHEISENSEQLPFAADNTTPWEFNFDCTEMTAFRVYYEYTSYKQSVDGKTITTEDYLRNYSRVTMNIGVLNGTPTISGLTKTATIISSAMTTESSSGNSLFGPDPDAPVNPTGKYGKGSYSSLTLEVAGKYNKNGDFDIISEQVEVFTPQKVVGDPKELLVIYDVAFYFNSDLLIAGQKTVNTDVNLTPDGYGYKDEALKLPTLKAFDFESGSFIYLTQSWLRKRAQRRSSTPAITEVLEPYVLIETLIKKEETLTIEKVLWSEETSEAEYYPYYLDVIDLEIYPTMQFFKTITPFATTLKSTSENVKDLRILNYTWVTPFTNKNGFYTYPEDLLERLSTDGTELWSAGSIRRLT